MKDFMYQAVRPFMASLSIATWLGRAAPDECRPQIEQNVLGNLNRHSFHRKYLVIQAKPDYTKGQTVPKTIIYIYIRYRNLRQELWQVLIKSA